MFYAAREAVVKLLNGYCSIASDAKYNTIHGKGCPSELASHLKILTPKQMFQRLTMTLAQEKACNTSENLLNKMCQIYIFFVFSKRNY